VGGLEAEARGIHPSGGRDVAARRRR
jgi:hypothetical protein